MHLGMSERVVRHQRSDVRQLGGFGFEEFSSRGDVEEQIAHGDGGSQRESGFFDGQDLAAGDFDDHAGGIFGGVGFQAQPTDGGDGGQRLAAKAQGRDAEQVVGVADFRSGVALEGEHGVVVQHAAAVVDDLDELLAARLDVDADAMGAGIERVLQQLLHHRCRALHDLAGSDLVGDIFGENVDAAHGSVVSDQLPVVGNPDPVPQFDRWNAQPSAILTLKDSWLPDLLTYWPLTTDNCLLHCLGA